MTRPRKKKASKAPKATVSFRHNFVPPIMGVLAFVTVLGILNSQWIIAQSQHRFGKPAAAEQISVDTKSPAAVNGPLLTIPKINVSAPIVVDEKSYNEAKVQMALRKGVLHYGTTALPGQKGNTVIVGHSSGQLWAPGSYKFVFTMLDKLDTGDTVIADYGGTRYIYKVTDKKIIDPTDLRALDQTENPTLTLITCTPVGTSKYRLIVHAQQVSPRPESAASMAPKDQLAPKQLPGSAGKSAWKTITAPFTD